MDELGEMAQVEGDGQEEGENPYGDMHCDDCGNVVNFQYATRSDVVCRWREWHGDSKGCGKVLLPNGIKRGPDGEVLLCPKCDARVFKPFSPSRWPYGRVKCACGHVLRSLRNEDNLWHPDNAVREGTNTPPPEELGPGEE
jgi:hypothetical protein